MDVIKIYTPEAEGGFAMPMADVSGVKRKFLDVAYADQSENQKMDIYLPDEGVGPFPVIVFIHGGAFWGGERRDFQMHYVANGIRRGYAVVSVDHRLSDEAKFPEPVYDVKAAIRFLRANAATYLLDTDHIGVCSNTLNHVSINFKQKISFIRILVNWSRFTAYVRYFAQ